MTRRTIIIGGGQAAISLIAELRQLAPERKITLISDEPFLPYQRPPLSKAYLGGEWTVDRLALRPSEWFASEGIETILGVKVESIDRKAARVHLADGRRLAYDDLVLSTGA